MPCDTYRSYERQTLQERNAEVEVALKQLEKSLLDNRARVVIDRATGAVAITGWKAEERRGVADVCAIRSLQVSGSWALRQALAKAEAQAGRKVNMQTVAAGVHSHDNGRTWSKD